MGRDRRFGWTRVLFAALVCLVGPSAAFALPGDETERPVRCSLADYRSASLSVVLTLTGLPLVGSSVEVNGATAKYILVSATGVNCDPIVVSVPRFEWSLVAAPTGISSSALTGRRSPSAILALASAGAYRIRFTACSGSCAVTVRGLRKTLPEGRKEIAVEAVSSIPMPPQTEPVLPSQSETGPSRFDSGEVSRSCQGGGGAVDPQWVTVGQFYGPANYKLLEGRVADSRLSHVDSFTNHSSQDHLLKVEPDPPFGSLVSSKPEFEREEFLGVEWESDSFPEILRPSPGDRVSVFGYWIHDCGHSPFYTEIHPPIGVVSHRSRPVTIPTAFRPSGYPRGFGANVRVPGVISDIWFNRRAGKMIGSSSSSCPQTGLHQPSAGHDDGACIEPPSLKRRYTFNVYLPRDPQWIAADAGRSAPTVPLYVEFTRLNGPGSGGPDPAYRVCPCDGNPIRDGVRWLEVTIDLRSFTDNSYARRLLAAWAYPAPDNWAARRWKIRLQSVNIHDDGDSFPAGDGDWEFLFNTNNSGQEWTTLFDSSSTVHGNETFNSAVQTGAGLGPDLILFPGQDILVHTSGFDDDGILSDTGVGSVVDLISQSTADFVCRTSSCQHVSSSYGGDARYSLHYEVRPAVTPVGGATLTQEARAVYDAYLIRSGARCNRVVTRACVTAPTLAPALTQDWHPRNVKLPPGSALEAEQTAPFARQETEEHVLTDISAPRLKKLLERSRRSKPNEYKRFVAELKQALAAVPQQRQREALPLLQAMAHIVPASSFPNLVPRNYRLNRQLRPQLDAIDRQLKTQR